jgi:hypothetical protein
MSAKSRDELLHIILTALWQQEDKGKRYDLMAVGDRLVEDYRTLSKEGVSQVIAKYAEEKS